MSKLFIGIDPGANGGIAFLQDDHAEAHKMPETAGELAWLLSQWDIDYAWCATEQVGPSRGQDDGRRQGVTSAFTFGRRFGEVLGVLAALSVKHELVHPSKWQREFDLVGKGKTGTEKKNNHKAVAQRLFPALKVTHALSDALLIAEWCRRNRGSEV